MMERTADRGENLQLHRFLILDAVRSCDSFYLQCTKFFFVIASFFSTRERIARKLPSLIGFVFIDTVWCIVEQT